MSIDSECFICKKAIKVKSEKRSKNTICCFCANNRLITLTLPEVELSNINREVLTKLHFKNSVFYSKKEFNEMQDDIEEELSTVDILLLKESQKYSSMTEAERKEKILEFSVRQKLDLSLVTLDKFVNTFIKYGLTPYTDEKYFFNELKLKYSIEN